MMYKIILTRGVLNRPCFWCVFPVSRSSRILIGRASRGRTAWLSSRYRFFFFLFCFVCAPPALAVFASSFFSQYYPWKKYSSNFESINASCLFMHYKPAIFFLKLFSLSRVFSNDPRAGLSSWELRSRAKCRYPPVFFAMSRTTIF